MQHLFFCGWLISLSIMSFPYNYVITYSRISFFFKDEKHPIACIQHPFFLIHSPVNGPVGCFRILASVNNTAMNMEICIHLLQNLISILLDIYSEVGLLDHIVSLLLIFWDATTLFSLVAGPFYVPNNVQGFSFFHILDNLFSLGFFIIANLKCEETSQWGKENLFHKWNSENRIYRCKRIKLNFILHHTQKPIKNGLEI